MVIALDNGTPQYAERSDGSDLGQRVVSQRLTEGKTEGKALICINQRTKTHLSRFLEQKLDLNHCPRVTGSRPRGIPHVGADPFETSVRT